MSPEVQWQFHGLGKISRRGFLRSAAAFAMTEPVLTRARKSQANRKMRPVLTYIGTYSSRQGPEGAIGHGEGIYLFEMNPATGALAQREVFRSDSNPAWLAFDPSRTHLYSANEISNYQGTNSGSVTAYLIDRLSGHLTLLNTVSSEGAGPAHLSVHPSGKYVLVANYQGGTVAVLPIRSNGEVGAATDVAHNSGKIGPRHATSAPAGSFAISGHDKPHAHMIQADPAGKFVLASDLGLDQIFVWNFDVEKGKLSPGNPEMVPLPPGDGPRHFTFHPNGHWFYSLREEGSTLVTYDYDATRGRLTAKQTISSLAKGFNGTNFTSEVMVSADAKFVYAANRLHDSIAWFSIGQTGKLTFAGEEWTRGDYPRSFNIDPTGNYLYSCNQRADAITTYRIRRDTGALTFTGQYTPVGTPAIIIFLT
ncbi:MAG TPA: lactonase family protein [Acidobacteriota bacterium]|nr:lactonase family protein [Acidobacteriota bacterium]